MSYYFTADCENLCFPVEKEGELLAALSKGLNYGATNITITEVFEEHGFSLEQREGYFYLQGEEYPSEDVLELIAPFVKDGGVIKYLAEDGERWGFKFSNGRLVELKAVVEWSENV